MLKTNLEQAQANLAAAEKDLADKTSDLEAKQQTLSELKAAQAQAEKVYNSLAAQLQAQEKQNAMITIEIFWIRQRSA